MEDSRHLILNLLQRHGHTTVEALSRHMGLASATVRRHLDILQRDQLVAFRQVKKKTGRPEHAYYLTEAGQESLPKHYDRVLGRLLQVLSSLPRAELDGLSGNEVLQLLVQRWAQQAVASAGHEPQDSLEQRVAKVVAVFEQEHFQPEVEEMNGSVRIHLHNCPFRSAAIENDSLCSYDSIVLSAILGTDVVREHCIREGSEGCCYVTSSVGQGS